MPVKRRATKRRLSPEAELDAWRSVFESGHDFFGDASALAGIAEPVWLDPADRAEGERVWREAAQQAWRRLGAAFLATYAGEGEPWALQVFGRPE